MTGTGVDIHTGRPLTGWDHVVQSIGIIFGTRIGQRVMRRQFGAGSLSLLGRRLTPRVVAYYRLLLVLALERWEPRVRVRSVRVTATVDGARAGEIAVATTVDYLPRGHLGDKTVAGTRDLEFLV